MVTITPATKIAALLEQWPELEPVLIAQAPAFQKLRNPVLRRTIARVATLEQAAGIAGISARDLVMTLRRAAGQAVDVVAETPGAPASDSLPPSGDVLPCARATRAAGEPAAPRVIDADALLSAGEVPLKAILNAAAALEMADCLRVYVAFKPVPLIDSLESKGFRCSYGTGDEGRPVLSVTRRADAGAARP